jgi:carbon-nitrogen hydrolase
MDWWTTVNRCRALENTAYVVAANQGASLSNYPPFSWPGGSMVVDYDGRVLAQASAGPGERIVVATVDIAALRHERKTRRAHQMLAHLRTEAYPMYGRKFYPGATFSSKRDLSIEELEEHIDDAKRQLGYLQRGEKVGTERINDLLTPNTKRPRTPPRSAPRRGSPARRSS